MFSGFSIRNCANCFFFLWFQTLSDKDRFSECLSKLSIAHWFLIYFGRSCVLLLYCRNHQWCCNSNVKIIFYHSFDLIFIRAVWTDIYSESNRNANALWKFATIYMWSIRSVLNWSVNWQSWIVLFSTTMWTLMQIKVSCKDLCLFLSASFHSPNWMVMILVQKSKKNTISLQCLWSFCETIYIFSTLIQILVHNKNAFRHGELHFYACQSRMLTASSTFVIFFLFRCCCVVK